LRLSKLQFPIISDSRIFYVAQSHHYLRRHRRHQSTMTIADRLRPAHHFKPEVASLNMGSMNFGLYDMLKRFKTFNHDWEVPYLANSDDRVFKNTFKDIAHILQSCSDNQTRFEIECYDIGHLYTAAHFIDRGLIKAPFLIQSVFGILGGIGPHPEDVLHMKRTADRLFGDAYVWSVLGAGRNQIPIATQSAAIRNILEGLSLEVATPDEARQILQLKGHQNVNF
jgi:uncharacterized protein (DUF849 family)